MHFNLSCEKIQILLSHFMIWKSVIQMWVFMIVIAPFNNMYCLQRLAKTSWFRNNLCLLCWNISHFCFGKLLYIDNVSIATKFILIETTILLKMKSLQCQICPYIRCKNIIMIMQHAKISINPTKRRSETNIQKLHVYQ